MIPWLPPQAPFPPVHLALKHPNGLLAAGADLTPARVLEAYRLGIFPWYNPGEPVLWWSPDPRMVLFPEGFKMSRSLAKSLRQGRYTVRMDTAFIQVMEQCAAPRPGQQGTWINSDIVSVYGALHRLGYAHSVEAWTDGELVGGLYGIALGRVFFGESMFSRTANASKIALAHLVEQIRAWDFGMIDCQVPTPHLASLGAVEIPREEFLRRLAAFLPLSSPSGPWECTANFR